MTLQYQEVYDRFLQKITDYSFLEYDANFIYDSMKGWLHSAASQPLVRAKFSTLSFDDEIIELNFALNTSVDDDSEIKVGMMEMNEASVAYNKKFDSVEVYLTGRSIR